MPIPEDLSPPSRRRVLLQAGEKHGWWEYRGENQPGFTDGYGVTYSGVSYSLTLPFPDPGGTPRTLVATEVEGYVLAFADQYGDDIVREIAYRAGLVTDQPA